MSMSLGQLRAALVEGPTWLFYRLLGWLYPIKVLRNKAAACPYDRTRLLLLRRSGIVIGKDATVHYGVLIVGIARTPPAVILGDRCAVSAYTCFITSSYPDSSHLGQHPEVEGMMNRLGPIHVGEDTWIGARAVIFPGVNIGAGAIIGAGSVVLKDVLPHTVVAGCPARVIRQLAANSEPICN
jgi:carbonic anhydrase/acetyltransferase-like protein (isoleucine patch superfamily)